MTATRPASLIAQTLIVAVFAVLVLGASQAVTASASASAYVAPTYGAAMIERGEAE
jgi:hypothetical protein